MRRRDLLTAGVPALAAPMLNFGLCRLNARPVRTFSTAAIDLVYESVVIDMLGLFTRDWDRLQQWHDNPASFTAGDLDSLRSLGIAVFNPAVDLNARSPYRETHRWLAGWNRLIDGRPDCFKRVASSADIAGTRMTGHVGVLLGMQNADQFRTVSDVKEFWEAGLRLSQLTYNGPNRLGDGCASHHDNGLTEFGAAVVRQMNETGMIVDVSHCGSRTTIEAIAESARPVLITHSNCAALVSHPRCKSDEIIRALARQGGVMGVTSVRTFLWSSDKKKLGNCLDHIEHIARIAGIEHAGIGSDIDPSEAPTRVYDIADGLLRRGWSKDSVRLVLGGNFSRAIDRIFRS